MALAIVNTHVPTLSLKRNSANNSPLRKSRVSPFLSPNSKRCNSIQTKGLINKENPIRIPDETDRLHDMYYTNFPRDFVFGAASSDFQVEGSIAKDGKKPSIWDTFCEQFPQKIADRSNGEPGAGSYIYFKEDVQRLVDIGLQAYRFSISWARLLPNGRGKPNPAAVEYYSELIYELKRHGIEPYVTIFHWSLPQALEDEYQGFLDLRIVEDFKNYANLCFELFGNQVKHWITFNEPSMFCSSGYCSGKSAPGRCTPNANLKEDDKSYCPAGDSLTEAYIVGHNLLLAHAEAYHLYNSQYKKIQNGQVGITLASYWFEPYDDTAVNKEAQQRALDFNLGWFLDPLVFGTYPFSMRALVRDRLPIFSSEESEKLKGSFDFIGYNYYTARYAKDIFNYNYTMKPKTSDDDVGVDIEVSSNEVPIGTSEAKSWVKVYPVGIKKMLLHIKERYNNPAIIITENGVYNIDQLGASPDLDDTFRIEYHASHLYELEEAISLKANVKGYFVWSLLDSFEFGAGYTIRFGMHYTDYNKILQNDKERSIPKLSARWLKSFLSKQPKVILMPKPIIKPL